MKTEFDLIASLLLWIHVTFAIAFLIGAVGYFLTVSRAAKEKDVKVVKGLMTLGKIFEKYFLLPGESILFFAGLLAAWWENIPVLGFLQGGNVNWLLVSLILFLSRIPLIMLIDMPREKLLNKRLEEAVGDGQITQKLQESLADRTIKKVQLYMLVSYMMIVLLMVMKPF
jgi:hypothetical protein